MPVVNQSKDRMADLIEELLDRIDDRPDPPAPVVNVTPSIHVEPAKVDVPAPVVNVAAPTSSAPGAWVFTVTRDKNNLITTITANPK